MIRAAVALAVLTCAPLGPATAQAAAGTIEGFARVETTDAPMPFSLVRLTQANGKESVLQQSITNSEGHFRFAGVQPGDYRLLILRIGYQPARSPLVHVSPGEVVHYDLRSVPLAIQLPTVMVRGTETCLGTINLVDDPELATLWEEARKGVETRRAFELGYRFTSTQRQEILVQFRLRRDRHELRIDTVANTPDSVVVREQRQRARHEAAGYGVGNLISVPNEKELLDERFLNDHCLETTIQRANGTYGVRFRALVARQSGYDIRGTIWLDSATYLVKRIEYEHLDGDKPFSNVDIEYADVRVGGSVLRLPSSGNATLRVRGPSRMLASGASATLVYTYSGFAEAPAK